MAEGETLDQAGQRLLQLVLETAGGKRSKNEQNGFRGIAIFKDGVSL